jgi:insulysin
MGSACLVFKLFWVLLTGLSHPLFYPPTPQHRGLLVRVVPIKESHTIEVSWDIPPTDQLYRQAPTNYLSHLLGHEGAGSAFALLKARGLATALSAGAHRCYCAPESVHACVLVLTHEMQSEDAEKVCGQAGKAGESSCGVHTL